VLLAVTAAALSACGGSKTTSSQDAKSPAPKKIKAGVLLLGNGTNDFLNLGFRVAATNAVAKLGKDKFDLKFVSGVGYNEQATATTQQLFRDGAKIVVDNLSLQSLFYDACAKYPDRVCLEEYPLGKVPDNVSGFWWKFWQGYYLEGVAAGLLTKTNTIGYLASFKQNYENAHMNALALGCQSVNPKCKLKAIIINNWYDAPKSTASAKTLVNAGADVLAQFVDDTSSVVVAKEMSTPTHPVWGFGLHLSQAKFGGDAYATSMLIAPATEREISLGLKAVQSGQKPPSGVRLYGLADGVSLDKWGPKVPKTVQERVAQVQQSILDGKDVFAGPIYDQAGKLRVPQGKTLSDKYIYASWDWRVQGITGG
jgi:basic membrane lipoprotein Med (substrate-binding protein (PBP1-ABC) superfamily)